MRVSCSRVAVILLLLSGAAMGQTLTNLSSFTGSGEGSFPYAPLIQSSDGNFYGTTVSGGASNNGTVFRISPGGNLTNLWSFTGGNDGSLPLAALVQGLDGNFYGTASSGGASNNGTVFRISPTGSLTNLWSFTGGSDGSVPFAALVQGLDGNFYGTASSGGASNNGTVFRISPAGSLTNLWSFTGGDDGVNPMAGLVRGSDGNFYGTTAGSQGFGFGTVFRISPTGSLTNLWSFTGNNDGGAPDGTLVQGSDGNFYGTTSTGGTGLGGTVFRIGPNGGLTNLWSFSVDSGGSGPNGALVLGSDGNFYGTTTAGSAGNGTVFRISPGGSFTNLWSFSGGNDGAIPYAGLVQGSDGNFYGTTTQGGAGNGAVFRLMVTLSPPANQISIVHVAGTNIVITLPSVAGETYQLQRRDSLATGSWSNVVGAFVTNSLGGPLTLTNFGGALPPHQFYRFDITP